MLYKYKDFLSKLKLILHVIVKHILQLQNHITIFSVSIIPNMNQKLS